MQITLGGRSTWGKACGWVVVIYGTWAVLGWSFAWASDRGDDWLAVVLGILVGGPAILLCVVMSILSGALRRRESRPWHAIYRWFALGLSMLIFGGIPLAAWWLFGGTRGAYDAALFAFPVAVAGAWSAWLAWLLKGHRAKGQ